MHQNCKFCKFTQAVYKMSYSQTFRMRAHMDGQTPKQPENVTSQGPF